MKFEKHLPKGWWKSPAFEDGRHYPCPYIWFAYWLITWEEDELWVDTFKCKFITKYGLTYLNYGVFSFLKIGISFMPD